MFQIEVNGIRMPTLYYSLREAFDACDYEKKRGCAVMTRVVHIS